MKILKMSPRVYKYYITQVRDNENTSYDQACKKLTRNVQLCKEFAPEKIKKFLNRTTYYYGNLTIKVRGKRVVKLENHKGVANKTNVDEKRYIELSREFGIK